MASPAQDPPASASTPAQSAPQQRSSPPSSSHDALSSSPVEMRPLPASSSPDDATKAPAPAPASDAAPNAPAATAPTATETSDAQPSQPSDGDAAPAKPAPPADLNRSETEAIGPSTDTPAANPDNSNGPVVVIMLLLTTGARHPYKIDEKYLKKRNVIIEDMDPYNISVYTLKELIWRDWREGTFDSSALALVMRRMTSYHLSFGHLPLPTQIAFDLPLLESPSHNISSYVYPEACTKPSLWWL